MDSNYLSKGSIIEIINSIACKFNNINVSEFDVSNLQEISSITHRIGCQAMNVADITVKIPAKSADCEDYLLCTIRVTPNSQIRVKLQQF